MPKVLITEHIHENGPKLLEAAGYELVYADRNMDIIRKEIVDADAVVVRIIDLDAALLSTAKNLKVISKHGVGYDNIDVSYCKEHGIHVTLCPGANSQSVAEHTFALMLSLGKTLTVICDGYRDNGFSAKNCPPGVEFLGKTIGIIGVGQIGKRLAKMCAFGLDMKVLAYDPYVTEAPAGVTMVTDLDELLAASDVVTLHCLLTDETRRIINAERIAKMKPGVIFLNCARGPMVDEAALIDALQSGHIRAAGLDVSDPEPVAPDSVLFRMKNVLLTPHFAPTTIESAINCGEMCCQNVIDILNGVTPEGILV